MNKKVFFSLALATLALILIAVLSNALRTTPGASVQTGALLPQFDSTRASIDRIVVSKGGQNSVQVQRQSEQWLVSSRFDHPANAGALRTLFEDLNNAQQREAKTSDPTRYQQLGVHTEGQHLQLSVGDSQYADLILGEVVTRPAGQFVRRADEAQSWLIDREIQLPVTDGGWLQFSLPKMSSVDVQKVERYELSGVQCVAAPCPESERVLFSLSKQAPEDTSFTLTPLPAGKSAGQAWKIAGITEVLNGLNSVNDVAKRETLLAENAKPVRTRFIRFDGLQVDTELVKKGEEYWLAFAVTAHDEAAEEVKAEAKKYAELLTPWSYQIASYKGEGLARGHTDLLQDQGADANQQ